jgi:hypothetical protein
VGVAIAEGSQVFEKSTIRKEVQRKRPEIRRSDGTGLIRRLLELFKRSTRVNVIGTSMVFNKTSDYGGIISSCVRLKVAKSLLSHLPIALVVF